MKLFKRNLKQIFTKYTNYILLLFVPFLLITIFVLFDSQVDVVIHTFELNNLIPGILVLSYILIMIILSNLISKDFNTSIIKGLIDTGTNKKMLLCNYLFVGLLLGVIVNVFIILLGLVVSFMIDENYFSFLGAIELMIYLLPMLLTTILFGIFLGSTMSQVGSNYMSIIFLALAGLFSGTWTSFEKSETFEAVARCFPFYPSVYLGRIATGGIYDQTLVYKYRFDDVAKLGFIPILVCLFGAFALALIYFNKRIKNYD